MELEKALRILKNKVSEWNKYKNENVISNMELLQEIDDENIAIDTVLEELNNRNEIIENIKEYVNAPEFLDWHLGYKTIDELEKRQKEINILLKE